MRDLEVCKELIKERGRQKIKQRRRTWAIIGSCAATCCTVSLVLLFGGFLSFNSQQEQAYANQRTYFMEDNESANEILNNMFQNHRNNEVEKEKLLLDNEADSSSVVSYDILVVGTENHTVFWYGNSSLMNQDYQLIYLTEEEDKYIKNLIEEYISLYENK